MKKTRIVSIMLLLTVMLTVWVVPPVSTYANNNGERARDNTEYDGEAWLRRNGYSDPKHTTIDTVKYTYGQEEKIKYYISEKTKTVEVGCNFQLRAYSNFGKDKQTTLVKSETADHKRIADIISWDSTNPEVATVDVTGYVEPINAGETTIKASFKVNGKKKTLKCNVTVTDTPITLKEIETMFLDLQNDGYAAYAIENFRSMKAYNAYMAEHGDEYATVETACYVISWLEREKEVDYGDGSDNKYAWALADLDECSTDALRGVVAEYFACGFYEGHLVKKNSPTFEEFKEVYVPSEEYIYDKYDNEVMIRRDIKNDYYAFIDAFSDRFMRYVEPQRLISTGCAEKVIKRALNITLRRTFTYGHNSGVFEFDWDDKPLMIHEGLEYASSMADLFGWSWAEPMNSNKRYASFCMMCDGMSRAFVRDMMYTKAEWEAMDTDEVFVMRDNGRRTLVYRDELNPLKF